MPLGSKQAVKRVSVEGLVSEERRVDQSQVVAKESLQGNIGLVTYLRDKE